MRITERAVVTLGTREAAAAIEAAASRLAERMQRSESHSVLSAARELFGDNAAMARAMGYRLGPPGSRERTDYNDAMRALQRAQKEEGTNVRPFPAKYADKLAAAVPENRPRLKEALTSGNGVVNEPRTGLPDSGAIGISYSGEVQISDYNKDRDLPEQEFPPNQFLIALDTPFDAFLAKYKMPDFTGSGVIELSYDDGF